MNAILSFLRAAAPWVAMGVSIMILIVRGVKREKKEEKQEEDYGTEDMCLGMCFGLLVGTMTENDIDLSSYSHVTICSPI